MENGFEFINILYVTAVSAVLALLIFAVISFLKPQNLKFQIWYILIASFACGIIASVVLINFSSKSALIWPVLFMIHVVNKAMEIKKLL